MSLYAPVWCTGKHVLVCILFPDNLYFGATLRRALIPCWQLPAWSEDLTLTVWKG
jgi:hypothetical protein